MGKERKKGKGAHKGREETHKRKKDEWRDEDRIKGRINETWMEK